MEIVHTEDNRFSACIQCAIKDGDYKMNYYEGSVDDYTDGFIELIKLGMNDAYHNMTPDTHTTSITQQFYSFGAKITYALRLKGISDDVIESICSPLAS